MLNNAKSVFDFKGGENVNWTSTKVKECVKLIVY